MHRSLLSLPVPLLAAALLSSCAPLAVATGVGATVGIAAAQEGGIKSAVADKAIYVKISDLWFKQSFEMYRKLNLTVKEGRVLIAGSLPTADMRVEAVRLAWQAEGVRQVINEVTVDEGRGLGGTVTDAWISSSVKTRLVLDRDVQSINYNVETVGGTVYLLGVGQDQEELSRALGLARRTKGVKNVVSYVRLRGETPSGVQQPTAGATAGTENIAPAGGEENVPASSPKPGDVSAEPLDAPR